MEHGQHSKAEALRRAKRGKDGKVATAFHEVFHNEPSTVRRADVSGKKKLAMMRAIALEKARKAGARIPKR